MRKTQEEHILELAHQLIHLLLSVTGAFPDYHIGKIEKRTFIGLRKAVAGLNQRTEILRKVFLRLGNGFIGSRTKRNAGRSGCHGDFLRKIGAVGPYYRMSRIFPLLYHKK